MCAAIVSMAVGLGAIAAGGGASSLRAVWRPMVVVGGLIHHREMLMDIKDADGDALAGVRTVAVAATVAWLGFFAQGLLGGFAMTHLFMTYFLDAANVSEVNADGGFLRYYSPIAVACQRVYVVLTTVALLA